MERYYQPEIECASQEQLRAWQDERLVKQVRNVWDNVPYYRKKMEEKGLTPDDIQGVADLHKLPFVTKADLREAYPYGLLARPLKDCVRIHSTSGTTGKRVVTCGRTAAPGPWLRPAPPMRMCARCPMATACSQAAPDSTVEAIRRAA